MVMRKKQIFTATLTVALIAAVAVNWYYTRPTYQPSGSENTTVVQDINLGDSLYVAGKVSEEATTEVVENVVANEEYFASARLRQESSNDDFEDEIEDILEHQQLSEDDKTKIHELLNEYKNKIKLQTDIENLIIAKTSSECIVIINNDTAQVILPSGVLDNTVLLQITEIFEKNANIFAENLTIIEAK